MQMTAKVQVGIRHSDASCRTSNEGTKSCFVEQAVLEADFANRLRTARGLGFEDLSRKERRIPRDVRKKMTITVVAVM